MVSKRKVRHLTDEQWARLSPYVDDRGNFNAPRDVALDLPPLLDVYEDILRRALHRLCDGPNDERWDVMLTAAYERGLRRGMAIAQSWEVSDCRTNDQGVVDWDAATERMEREIEEAKR